MKTTQTPKCQMLCGRCKQDATRVLHSGGKQIAAWDMGRSGSGLRTVAAPRRDIRACDTHLPQLESCADIYGGTIAAMK